MLQFKIFNSNREITSAEKEEIVSFLHTHLDQYGDNKADITKAIDFALRINNPSVAMTSLGGMVLIAKEEGTIAGAVVMNRTGMSGYIPENILVYIAIHQDLRGKGYGRQLMEKAIDLTHGDIKLHVEKDNPARFLYEKLGFTNPYLEMRLKNK